MRASDWKGLSGSGPRISHRMLGWGRWVGKLGSLLSLELNALAQPAGRLKKEREMGPESLRATPDSGNLS